MNEKTQSISYLQPDPSIDYYKRKRKRKIKFKDAGKYDSLLYLYNRCTVAEITNPKLYVLILEYKLDHENKYLLCHWKYYFVA